MSGHPNRITWRQVPDAGVELGWCRHCAGVLIRHTGAGGTELRFAAVDFERLVTALVETREVGAHPEGRYAVYVDLHVDLVMLIRTGDGDNLLLELSMGAWEALRIAAKGGLLTDLAGPSTAPSGSGW